MTALYRAWYRWHGGDGRWSGWQQGPLGEREGLLIDQVERFVVGLAGCEVEYVIEPEGQRPECRGGIPVDFTYPDLWWADAR